MVGRTTAGDGPGWLGLGWLGSGVVGGAGLAVVLGIGLGEVLSYVSDRTPEVEARPEIGPVLGAVAGVFVLLPVGALLGLGVGIALRALVRSDRATPPLSGLAGLGLGVALVAAIAVVLGVVVDPAAAPRLPAAAAVPAGLTGITGAGLALLMRRSAARLGAWPS